MLITLSGYRVNWNERVNYITFIAIFLPQSLESPSSLPVMKCCSFLCDCCVFSQDCYINSI